MPHTYDADSALRVRACVKHMRDHDDDVRGCAAMDRLFIDGVCGIRTVVPVCFERAVSR